ncbi:MAG TPA: zf-HC2 domain-containing protein [Thermoanaerobaculia bacterium]|nr:zf-HC2 domain-containing protein [Thermoanaerobaculia bacterium]
MKDDPKILAWALAILLREAERQLLTHPTAEQLAGYQAGTLSVTEAQALEEHLLFCTACSALSNERESPPEADVDEGPALSEAGVAAAWRSLQRRLRGEPRFEKLPGFLRGWLSLPKPALFLPAAALLVALLSPWFLIVSASEPRILAATELELPTRGGGVPVIAVSPSQHRSFALVVQPEGKSLHPEYAVELSAAGRPLLSQRWRPRASSDLLVVQVPKATSEGDYLLKLKAMEGGRPAAEPVEERPFRVEFR